ncbi:MAG: type III secretion system export apparatus subunit SctV [Paracoccus sp. (in: a-proteobacteria)]|uniref:type III secretion system export apparatus subunit SctV n=1 Tax=Paracoccus sp. TaxID=267 RepID=UPI0026E038DD|nr:type III secretion system export apparatus subunit SctV [Paracoccus sp. (in: a-proteobacteria)]MDO5621558.1 type III secretion system export apparatus subunit SctV [Paracoccus sp. (in: a-proteobacteria)]
MNLLAHMLRRIAMRQDLALILLLVLIVFMIILPLPTWLLDVLIGTNMSLSILILIVAVYLRNPTSFSTLPAILLFATLFRLAISISTTRMILLQADAGQIVETFGTFVLGGSLVVGIVVFLIITIVQFIVITKGAERVAEVSARFSLDALPGRQMSIDSDMRAGEIDMAEARRRREGLQLESEFYGSMDGAMKFVKGDAIAGLIIIAVNILGGLGVGVGQNGMPFGEALNRYSVLTVGDGMVSQIPALLMAIASGVVITRITHSESLDLGRDIATQIGTSPRAMQVAGLVMVGFAFIPGFPTLTFLALAALIGGSGLWIARQVRLRADEGDPLGEDSPTAVGRTDLMMVPMSPIQLTVGTEVAQGLQRGAFDRAALRERTRLFEELGVPFPRLQLSSDPELPTDRWQLRVENVPVAEGAIPPARLRLLDQPDAARILGLNLTNAPLSAAEQQSWWADPETAPALRKAGVRFQTAEQALAAIATARLPRHAAEFLGVQEVGALLGAMESRYESLVTEAQKALPVQKIAAIMRRLVEEEIPVRNLRIMLETIVEWAPREKDTDLLAEYVRAALARQISHKYADTDRMIAAYVIEADIEEAIRGAIRQAPSGVYLALEAQQSRRLLDVMKSAMGDLSDHSRMPVFIAAMDVRRFLRRFLTNHDMDLPVLSHKEVAPNYKVQPLAMMSIQ